MKDLVPPSSGQWQEIETTLKRILASYGYEEIRFPIMEFTQVFERSIGDVTDIVLGLENLVADVDADLDLALGVAVTLEHDVTGFHRP